MRTVVRPQGRLPARVYWVRRGMVVLTVVALVFAVGRLLDGSDSSGPDQAATMTAGTPTTSATGPATPAASPAPVGPLPLRATTSAKATGKKPRPSATGTPVLLAAPTGPCAADEITVTPTVPEAVAGRQVALLLELTSIKPACTFAVSHRTLVARVTSGKDRIWSTQDCRKAVPARSVVVRSAEPTKVVVPWSGRRSDDECTRSTAWALPGYYHVSAAVMGSEPGDTQFRLTSPPRPVVTKTVHPKPKKKQKAD